MTNLSGRLFFILCGALLIAGIIVFAWGGQQHPVTTPAALGATTLLEYGRAFAHMTQHGDWAKLHTGILAGPVLWALGAVGLNMVLRERGELRWSTLGTMAFAMGAVAWAVAFIFDGYVVLTHAAAVIATENDPSASVPAIAGMRAAEAVTLRLGLVGLVLLGVGMASLSMSLLVSRIWARPVRWFLGIAGILIGFWPTYAWATGIFLPGPFGRPGWVFTVISFEVWLGVLALALIVHGVRNAPEPDPSGLKTAPLDPARESEGSSV